MTRHQYSNMPSHFVFIESAENYDSSLSRYDESKSCEHRIVKVKEKNGSECLKENILTFLGSNSFYKIYCKES